jgi:hypothetical protein
MLQSRRSADARGMIVRLVTLLAAVSLLAGCSSEEGLRAQELLLQAEAAQAKLTSSTFDGSLGVAADGMNIRMNYNGATSKDGEWFSMHASGVPNGNDMEMQVVVRGGRAWLNADGRWQSTPVPAGTTSNGTLSAAAFQQLARYVKAVRVKEHQVIQGKTVTTIAGEIDTQGMVESFAKFGSLAEGASFDLSKLGLDIGDIHAVLTVDEQTHLLVSALVGFEMKSDGRTAKLDLRYRLSGANKPVTLPSPSG